MTQPGLDLNGHQARYPGAKYAVIPAVRKTRQQSGYCPFCKCTCSMTETEVFPGEWIRAHECGFTMDSISL